MENLTGLQSLDLSWCNQLTDLQGLENLPRLQSLNLSRCAQLTDLQGLENLTDLQSLNLSGCEQLTDLKGLENLTGLQSLDLSWCDQLTDLKGLENLSRLQSLDLSRCAQLTDLQGLENLSRLQSLNLSSCFQLTDLKGLENLTDLQSLNLSWCEQLADLKGLENLSRLQSLSLSRCEQLADLQGLENLTHLQSLNLSACRQLADLKGLENLPRLQSLNLSGCEQLTDLQGLENLTHLQSLDLSACRQLADLKGLENLPRLQSLNLSECDRITHLNPLEKLICLKEIYISQINDAVWLYHFPRLVDVKSNAIDNVPVELLSDAGNALIPITAWQRDLLASGSAPNSELKLFILGNGGIGKTQISRRLQGSEYDPAVPSTHGIHLGRFRILEADDHAPGIYLNLWDFGGQDVYLSTHGLFLDERAIYVVAWHPEFENQDEYQQNGVPMRNRLLGYWLAYIRSLAGADAPVIVVQTQCDEADTETAAPLPQDHGFNYLKTTGCSALQDYGLERLLPEIRNAARLLRKRYAAVEIPQSWVDLEQDLRELRDGGQKTLAFEAFESQCQQRNQLAPPALIANFLHRAGQVFWRQGAFGNDLVLRQDWALAGIYAILERNTVLPQIRRDGGVFHLTQLQNAVWRDFNEQEQRMFIDMMVQCNACFALGDDVYVATELLPDEQDMASPIQSTWRNATADAHVRLAYDFFMKALSSKYCEKLAIKQNETRNIGARACAITIARRKAR
ncbi:leucine-rich repeat domain-containing protein [Nitrosomonas oligotropha]|uniref:Internalin A n=1 Tax=Nitrosomonas oligotropha TaxID=42354 RepID=A0A1H8SHP9_9PROT|nr:leucine-rich repeat domain-containing protein [Nitrosomonas oligotropha]SDX14267.1 internalin A [Nitrosomonas oligotropha]SEO78202.1 internalin A [Nitrosomonas oligotropha]